MDHGLQYTLWLWTEGAFARRVIYQLLYKGLVSSTAALLQGETTEPILRVIPVSLESRKGWTYGDSTNRPPTGSSNPCMRIWDTTNDKTYFVYESTSIILLLEELFPKNPMQTSSIIFKAQTADLLGKINLIAMDTNYFLRNTVPEHGSVMGLNGEQQSQISALNARSCETHGLLKLQGWAEQNGLTASAGWLTPGIDGPGLVDITLASNHRFVELMYNIDMLGDNRLATLASWYNRFKKLPWWAEFEERDGIVPPMLANGRVSRAAWVGEGDHF